MGDYQNGNIYTLKDDVFTDNDETVIRLRDSQTILADGRYIIHTFGIDTETGVGLTTGQGSDPQAMIRWSFDGGRTWSHEFTVPLGKKGEYDTISEIHNIGPTDNQGIMFRVSVSDPVDAKILGAYVMAERLS